ncbi:MAG: superoxide dismutase [Succinivibrio sp.]|nr:superoxide dismutase [Succinivibrio sp.]
MAFSIAPLPYAKNTLNGFLSEQTLTFHHDKHFQAYIDTTNKLVAGTADEGKSLTDLIKTAQGPLFNNAAQAFNHEFYFNCISPQPLQVPAGLKAALESAFGSVDSFLEKFTQSAAGNFGSGWTWLVNSAEGLKIVNTSNAGNPLTLGQSPLLTVDVWEHAYYLDFQNRRPDYLKSFVAHINWDFVAGNLT